jgi:hypothetical protein
LVTIGLRNVLAADAEMVAAPEVVLLMVRVLMTLPKMPMAPAFCRFRLPDVSVTPPAKELAAFRLSTPVLGRPPVFTTSGAPANVFDETTPLMLVFSTAIPLVDPAALNVTPVAAEPTTNPALNTAPEAPPPVPPPLPLIWIRPFPVNV